MSAIQVPESVPLKLSSISLSTSHYVGSALLEIMDGSMHKYPEASLTENVLKSLFI